MTSWLRVSRKADLKKRLVKLDQDKLVLLHPATGRFFITALGNGYVQEKKLAMPV